MSRSNPEHRRPLRCLLLFVLGLFTGVALWTYHPGDLCRQYAAFPKTSTQNACGQLGSLIASQLLEIFGLQAFWIPILILMGAYKGVSLKFMWRAVLHVLLAGVGLGAWAWAFALYRPELPYAGRTFLSGGLVAAGLIHLTLPYLSLFGSALVSLGLGSAIALFYIPHPVRAYVADTFRRAFRSLPRLIASLASPLLARTQLIWQRSWPAAPAWSRATLAPSPRPIRTVSPPPMSPSVLPPRIEPLPERFEIVPRQLIPAEVAAPAPAPATAWRLPPIDFLKKPPVIESAVDRSRLVSNTQILEQKFADFGIAGEVTAVRPGPVITLYEFKPGPGVKVSRIAALADDLSMALSAESVRILAPLPGKSVVGIEIPSDSREMVYLREFLQHPDFYGAKHQIPVVMGKDIGGQTTLSDLARMPHLLCAGQTGAGKSVFMNGLICSLFYRFSPAELRMILVDPKFIEFRAYQELPHLLLPVVDDPHQASLALRWAVREMERRYRVLARVGARNLATFNQKIEDLGTSGVEELLFAPQQPEAGSEDWIQVFEPDEHNRPRVGKLPYIVIIIDELADLMMIAKKEVEISIARIAQKARAAGIHLIIATQRPSTDVVTGLIKANLPSRVSFQLASYIDSKTILDRAGAERLLGQGDMLFIPPGISQTLRLHGAYLDDEEIAKIANFLKAQGKPRYRNDILKADPADGADETSATVDDPLFTEGMDLVRASGQASASYLQRHLKIGYNRAARMIETMEERGLVGPADGARPREVRMRMDLSDGP